MYSTKQSKSIPVYHVQDSYVDIRELADVHILDIIDETIPHSAHPQVDRQGYQRQQCRYIHKSCTSMQLLPTGVSHQQIYFDTIALLYWNISDISYESLPPITNIY